MMPFEKLTVRTISLVRDHLHGPTLILTKQFVKALTFCNIRNGDHEIITSQSERSLIEELVMHHAERNPVLNDIGAEIFVPNNMCGFNAYCVTTDKNG